MRVLAVDVGVTNVKFLTTGQKVPRQAADWQYDVVAIGLRAPRAPRALRARPHAAAASVGAA